MHTELFVIYVCTNTNKIVYVKNMLFYSSGYECFIADASRPPAPLLYVCPETLPLLAHAHIESEIRGKQNCVHLRD